MKGISRILLQSTRAGLRIAFLTAILVTLSGCVWLRLYETKAQLAEFDDHFRVDRSDRFALVFKHPLLYSGDFDDLTKLRASRIESWDFGRAWHYDFYKIDERGQRVEPAVTLSFELKFNRQDRLSKWTLSRTFLQMMPPAFLEASLRSLGNAEVNEGKRQLRASSQEVANRVAGTLPRRQEILAHLGVPIEIRNGPDKLLYVYHFQLDSRDIVPGYEDRALSEVKLYFDPVSDELIKMSGRFAGLKVSIDYGNMIKKDGGVA